MKPKNLKEFKALIERYESITLEEIKKDKFDSHLTAQKLTGFGGATSCSICDGFICKEFVYGVIGCTNEINEETYYRIINADTPVKLRNAFRARAKHMKTLINSKS